MIDLLKLPGLEPVDFNEVEAAGLVEIITQSLTFKVIQPPESVARPHPEAGGSPRSGGGPREQRKWVQVDAIQEWQLKFEFGYQWPLSRECRYPRLAHLCGGK